MRLNIKISLSYVNNASTYAIGLRLTILQTYLCQYWYVANIQKKGGSDPRPRIVQCTCVDIIIRIII